MKYSGARDKNHPLYYSLAGDTPALFLECRFYWGGGGLSSCTSFADRNRKIIKYKTEKKYIKTLKTRFPP